MSEKVPAGRKDLSSGTSAKAHAKKIDAIYREHAGQLTAWLRRRFGDGPPAPEDIAQEAFEKFCRLPSIDQIENSRAFLYTIASNLAVSGIRSNVRARSYIDTELSDSDLETEKITPERVLEGKESLFRVQKAFEGLTERQRQIVILSRLYGRTYMQIRAERGWSLGTIAADMKIAMAALADVESDNEETSS